MITIDELKVQLAEQGKAVKDLEEALAIDASRKRVQELEHTMTRPGFYDDAEASKKVFDEVGDLKGKLGRYEKLQGLYEDAQTMLVMLEEENDPSLIPEGEEAVNAVEKAVDELQLMTMLNGEYDHSNAILTFHAGTGGTEAQDWAEMLYRMYTRWAANHGMNVEVLDYQDGDEAGIKSASIMVKGANAYGLLKSTAADQLCIPGSDARAGQHHPGGHPARGHRDAGVPFVGRRRPAHQQDIQRRPADSQAHRHCGELPDPAQPVPEP